MTPYYQDEHVTLYHGDSRDVMAGIDLVDHIITDPPYSASTHNGARTRTVGAKSKRLVTFQEWTSRDLQEAIEQFGRITKRWVIATMDIRHVAELLTDDTLGLRFVRVGVWVKPNSAPQLTGDRPAPGWEPVAILHNSDTRLAWNGGGKRGVWTANTVPAVDHPTAKPLPLIAEWVRLFTNPGETILDPFAGSGTTLVAAKQEGRRAIGVELEEKYCEIIAQRLSQGAFDFA